MLFFQLPLIPEWLLTRRGARALVPAYRRLAVNPDAFPDDDIRIFREAFLKPGAATAAINYYRNLGRSIPRTRDRRVLEVPTLLIWGDRDPYLGIRLSRGVEPFVRDLTVRHIPDAGHFVHQERAGEVNQEIRIFLDR
jgi:pimeloyl-ACP methyl ester carboxylesterase